MDLLLCDGIQDTVLRVLELFMSECWLLVIVFSDSDHIKEGSPLSSGLRSVGTFIHLYLVFKTISMF